jgi:hypothetical protein
MRKIRRRLAVAQHAIDQAVGQLYAQFAKDLREGTHIAPDFNMPYHGTVCSARFKPLLRQA